MDTNTQTQRADTHRQTSTRNKTQKPEFKEKRETRNEVIITIKINQPTMIKTAKRSKGRIEVWIIERIRAAQKASLDYEYFSTDLFYCKFLFPPSRGVLSWRDSIQQKKRKEEKEKKRNGTGNRGQTISYGTEGTKDGATRKHLNSS
jgi:hypothetical protein